MDKVASEVKEDNRPSPSDFEVYLPWACKQLQLESTVQVQKIYQNEYVSVAVSERSKKGKSRGKINQSRVDVKDDTEKEDRSTSVTQMRPVFETTTAKVIKVQAIYDTIENLVQLKFLKNTQLPRVMIKIIGLIIKFQNFLNTITINGGLDMYTIYEICKFLPTSHITEICLDGCYLKEPNYYLLLEQTNLLKYLSLCRCKIDDITVESLCSRLVYPLPASKTLSILNLSSNRITDEGAKFLANALCSNRQLSYLNLASNIITDKGASEILSTLMEFPLSTDEVLAAKTRLMTFLKTKNEMIATTIRELRMGEADKRAMRRKPSRPAPVAVKKLKTDISQKSIVDTYMKSIADMDSAILEKAVMIVDNALGNFVDPYSNTNSNIRAGVTYCKGNNVLCCLNLSYNYLSYLSLRKLQAVLLYQKLANRKPRGLLSVSVEGNNMPVTCKELSLIDDILEINLMSQTRKLSGNKKRPPPRSLQR
ncbi:uncharacterized protein [Epargyreus clarus]|uniref:uncharacterized protein n=1 Tax=Epargyreus clarus TaxID=520877 RepID=UPI003C2D0A44